MDNNAFKHSFAGEFLSSPQEISSKLEKIKAVIFDWDGVFHGGYKDCQGQSSFSEADSMGTNLLRYAYWIKNSKQLHAAIVTGEGNAAAVKLSDREHFDLVYLGIADKKQALDHACSQWGIKPCQVACVFDDINDLSLVNDCGLKIQISRQASPLFSNYVKEKGLADYVTASCGGQHAVREACELFMGLLGIYDKIIASRVSFDETYQCYWQIRNSNKTNHYVCKDGLLVLNGELSYEQC